MATRMARAEVLDFGFTDYDVEHAELYRLNVGHAAVPGADGAVDLYVTVEGVLCPVLPTRDVDRVADFLRARADVAVILYVSRDRDGEEHGSFYIWSLNPSTPSFGPNAYGTPEEAAEEVARYAFVHAGFGDWHPDRYAGLGRAGQIAAYVKDIERAPE